jgi:hypothetical protein
LPGEEKCCNCQLAKRDKAHPANIRIADTWRRRCRKGNHREHIRLQCEGYRKGSHREHPRLQREGCSTHTSPPQVYHSLWHSEIAQSNSSGLNTPGGSGRFSHNGTKGLCTLTSTRTASNWSVSWGSKCKQFASRQYVQNSNCSTSVYDNSLLLCQRNRKQWSLQKLS